MDNLTHSLVGAVMGQAGLKKKTGLAMPALIIGANLPDVDAACFFWLEGAEHLGFRRGITHGPPALILLPLILAGLLWAFDRWQAKRGKRPEKRLPVHFGWLYALSFIGCLSHPLFDWLNVYGIRFFEPFSSAWFHGDTLFIIDLWLWAILGLTLWWSLRKEKKGGENWTKPAWIGIAVGVAYIGANWLITWFDYNAGGKYSEPYPAEYISSPAPFFFWQRERIARLESGRWISDAWGGTAREYGYSNSEAVQCALPDLEEERKTNSELDAFLFWTRAPMAEGERDGSVVLYDARFYDPRARDRFSVALPHIRCDEIPAD
ncbi:metal-dependent hydrolase [uncultured Erythrobacter sp.]|uniref:metal-dependent hydrolase n=1 Tax=uncultured Erythrobacter sp. TaxID=263913 RepID=UPI00260A1B06|nr:metal-dependent hydrolase [uncultured Erythrobacter sp.]